MVAHGIPTKHRGRQYRSRLEARWARMFELLGWGFEYEPFDLPGWIPDFAIRGTSEDGEVIPILVEIKPTFSPSGFPYKKIASAVTGFDFPLTQFDQEVLLLGANIQRADNGNPAIGWLYSPGQEPPTDELAILRAETKHHQIGFCSEYQSFHCRITGHYDGDCFYSPDFQAILRLWNEAANSVQWMAPK